MGFSTSISTCFSKFLVFSGRASRSEYWFFFLFNILVSFVASLFIPVLAGVISFVLFFPTLSVTIRRLHDCNKSGWNILAPLGLSILAGIFFLLGATGIAQATFIAASLFNLYLFILLLIKGAETANSYGDPAI